MSRYLILGSEGSMGTRYQSILRQLNLKYSCYDPVKHNHENIYDYDQFDGIILATPTYTHFNILQELKGFKKRILCEKPVTKDFQELEKIISWGLDLTMMLQYQHLLFDQVGEIKKFGSEIGPSYYNYFRTGKDGLCWDCMQTIALHNGPMEKLNIKNDSPVWSCMINNETLRFNLMDHAYIRSVMEWAFGAIQDENLIFNAHKKVIEYKEIYGQGFDRHSSAQ